MSVLAWGKGLNGELGDGSTEDRPVPTALPPTGVSKVWAGQQHMLCALDGPIPEPVCTITPVPKGLVVGWAATEPHWVIGIREKEGTFVRSEVPPGAHSMSWTGLKSGAQYEVGIESPAWGKRVLEGIPL